MQITQQFSNLDCEKELAHQGGAYFLRRNRFAGALDKRHKMTNAPRTELPSEAEASEDSVFRRR
jgi:hypothetical protein